MRERVNRFLDRLESRLALVAMAGGSLTVGGVGAWLASVTKWLDAYGPISWLFAGLGAFAIALLICVFFAWLRHLLIRSSAARKWKDQIDYINPLDSEFNKKQIRLQDLVHPLEKRIENKKITNCRLLGPITLVAEINSAITFTRFTNCDFVVARPGWHKLYNAVFLRNVEIYSCELINCIIIVEPALIKIFKQMNIEFLTLTGDPEIDNPQQQDTEQKTQPKNPHD